MRNGKFFIILVLLCTFYITLFGQSVELLYQDRRIGKDLNIRIYFSDENGNESISPENLADSPFFHFCFAPIGDWTFAKKDIKKRVKPIQLKQNDTVLSEVELKPIQTNGEIILIVLSFDKSGLDYTNNLYFESNLGRTDSFNILEEYWPVYNEYKSYYDQGRDSFESNEYLKSFQVLKYFLTNDSRITALSFYNDAINLNRELVSNYITDNEKTVTGIEAELENFLDKNNIDKLVSISMELSMVRQNFTSFFDFSEDSLYKELEQNFDDFLSNLNNRISEYNVSYRDMKLSIFETGNYIDYKFELFIDLLARMTLEIKFLNKIDGFKSIDIALIDEYSHKKQELEELEWLDEFTAALQLINEDIRKKGYILAPDAIENLENQKQFEKQPYYNIFVAFNALVNNDLESFSDYIKQSFEKLTDRDLLYIFEFWDISYIATKNDIRDKVLTSLNTGLENENEGNFDEAIKQYKIAMRLSSNFAPPMFFLGRIYHKQEEDFTAERYFAQSLNIFPNYMAPRLYKISFLIELEDYTTALAEVDLALTHLPYWYFYYKKAQILDHLKQYKEAKNVLLEKCMPLNDYHFDSYILLGDISISLQDKNGAREYYLQAGNINPENRVFTDKMKELKNIKFPESQK